MQDTLKEAIQYQWKKGDKFGQVETVKGIEGEFTNFESGGRIYTTLISEFLEIVTLEGLPFPGAESIDTKKTTTQIDPINPIKPAAVSNTVEPIKTSPLSKLIKTLSSKNVESFDLSVGINLPKKEVFNMLVENSEEESSEILEEISKSAASQIEINNLQDFLKEQINEFVTNYYKS
jgi:hypothetical protein